MEIDHTCANPGCDCHVAQAGDYCDDSCRKHAEQGDAGLCECRHADCGAGTPETTGVPDQGAGVREPPGG